ncbi:hypothetical protein [Streptomyces sp. UNOC14_S4]|uniref:hypothetical protein n=1 Tax=Streptomyces sp. UNOC14_S4 TaxID=2872340 RepID=UPI001E2A93C1|nr:hypothetical protein [Streptomyces sp. UNOC14_S4]MCC3768247.1 hypothetical protein [Streptomyces sp. UNOC14_S4]
MALLLTAGCSSQAPRPPAPALGPIPEITSVDAISLPIDSYIPTSTQFLALQKAADVVSARCMRGYGLPYHPPITEGFADFARQNRTRTALYGFFDLSTARSKGYATQLDSPDGTSSGVPYTMTEMGVLRGQNASGATVATFKGKKVPTGGCRQQGIDAIGGPPPIPAVEALPEGGPKIPPDNPHMKAVNARWAACMKGKGFVYPNPWAAYSSPKWRESAAGAPPRQTPQASEEIATATADVECKLSTNLVGVAVAVEIAYDRQYIEAHTARLATFRQRLGDQLRAAARLTGSSPA